MNFGEKFRTEHSNLSGSMSKAELDTYAEKLESKINEATFDKEHDTLFIKNSTLTEVQIDYLQLKLNIHIYRLNQEKIGLNPFETCNIEAGETLVDGLIEIIIPTIVTFIVMFSTLSHLTYSSIASCITSYLMMVCLVILNMFGIAILIRFIIKNYRNKKYIKALQESNEI